MAGVVSISRKTFDYLLDKAKLAEQYLGTGARRQVPRQGGLAGPNIQYVECTSTTPTSSLYPGRIKEFTVVSDGSLINSDPEVVVWLRLPNDEVPTVDTIYGCLFAGIRAADDVAIFEGLSPVTAGSVDVFPVCQGRLTAVQTDPVFFRNTNGNITTLYLSRYNGNRITLYNGSSWEALTIPLTSPSVAVPSTNFRRFDVFAYNNSGAVALETVDWNESTGSITGATAASPCVITSTGHGLLNNEMIGISGVGGISGVNGNVFYVANRTANTFELNPSTSTGTYTSGGTWHRLTTTRATALAGQDGVKVKSGDATRLYLGTCLTILGHTLDNYHRRLIANYFNRVPRIITGGAYTLGAFSGTAATWKFPQAASAGNVIIVSPDRATTVAGQPDGNLFLDLRCTIGFDCDTAGEYLLNSFSINGQGGPGSLGTIETQIPESTTQVLIARSELRNVNNLDAASTSSGVFLVNAMCAPSSSGATYTLRDLASEATLGLVFSAGFHGTVLN